MIPVSPHSTPRFEARGVLELIAGMSSSPSKPVATVAFGNENVKFALSSSLAHCNFFHSLVNYDIEQSVDY